MVKIDAKGASHSEAGLRFTDFYAYGEPVRAMATGRVVDVADGEREDSEVLRKADETKEAYARRVQAGQATRLKLGNRALLGNYVVIDQGSDLLALYAHLIPSGGLPHQGDLVSAGQILGAVGSSGNSTEPHLHLQLCRGKTIALCTGVPMQFSNVELPRADSNRQIQTGDIVIGR